MLIENTIGNEFIDPNESLISINDITQDLLNISEIYDQIERQQ